MSHSYNNCLVTFNNNFSAFTLLWYFGTLVNCSYHGIFGEGLTARPVTLLSHMTKVSHISPSRFMSSVMVENGG